MRRQVHALRGNPQIKGAVGERERLWACTLTKRCQKICGHESWPIIVPDQDPETGLFPHPAPPTPQLEPLGRLCHFAYVAVILTDPSHLHNITKLLAEEHHLGTHELRCHDFLGTETCCDKPTNGAGCVYRSHCHQQQSGLESEAATVFQFSHALQLSLLAFIFIINSGL